MRALVLLIEVQTGVLFGLALFAHWRVTRLQNILLRKGLLTPNDLNMDL